MLDLTAGTFNTDTTPTANAPYGSFKNEQSPGAKDGTKLAAQFFQDLYYAIYNVIDAAPGVVVSGTVEGADEILGAQDLLDALYAIGKLPAMSPFMNYALLQEQATADEASVVGWKTRPLNTEAVNNITGSSFASNQITLPAGEYLFKGFASFFDSGSGTSQSKAALYNVTDGTYAMFGSPAIDRDSGGDKSLITGKVTLASTKTFDLRQYSNEPNSNGFGTYLDTGEVGDYSLFSQLEIWKLD